MNDDHDTPRSNTALQPRRKFLKVAGAASVGVGFPFVHAQEKVTLRYLGTAVNQDKKIAEKFEADTGIKIQYVAVTTDDVTKRAVTAPNSFDLIDTEYFSLQQDHPDRQPAGHRHQAHQERRQDHHAVHQGRGRRQEGGRPGHGAEEGDVSREARLQDVLRRRRRPT